MLYFVVVLYTFRLLRLLHIYAFWCYVRGRVFTRKFRNYFNLYKGRVNSTLW